MKVRRVLKVAASLSFAVGVLAGNASAAGAVQPSPPSCYGKSVSALAGPGFGQGVVFFAQDPVGKPGLGDGVQAFQSGLVPDEVIPNTCN